MDAPASRSSSEKQFSVGVEAPTPRGSNPMKSKFSPIGLSASGPASVAAAALIPELPGPPGL